MNKSLTKILNDNDALNEYISDLEHDIDNTETVDNQLDTILNNILTNYDYFKDRRSLRASNFEALGTLLRLKAELPQKRIQSKRQLLDILTKKEELAIKKQEADASSTIANSTGSIINAIFNNFDINGINPKLVDADVLDDECEAILDKSEEVNTDNKKDIDNVTKTIDKNNKEKDKEELINIMENAKNPTDILALQERLSILNGESSEE